MGRLGKTKDAIISLRLDSRVLERLSERAKARGLDTGPYVRYLIQLLVEDKLFVVPSVVDFLSDPNRPTG